MSHISGRAVAALMALTEVKAADDVQVCLMFDNSGKAITVNKEDGHPVTLGDLRELAAAFGAWM